MIELLNLIEETYSQVLAIANYLCFGVIVFCAVFLITMATLGQFDKAYKHPCFAALLVIILLFIIHFLILENFGIPLLVPPIQTAYFTAFMHVMQYVASIGVVVLGVVIFLAAALSRISKNYGGLFMSSLVSLIIIGMLHFYLEDNFGIKLILPPTLW